MKLLIKTIFFLLVFTQLLIGAGKNDMLLLPSPKLPINIIIKRAMFLSIFNTGKRIVAVGEQGFIIYTDDNAKTWHQADVPVRVTLNGVYFTDEKNGWVVGNCGVILHTKDGGKTWLKQLDGYKANKLVVKGLKEIIEKELYDNSTLTLDDLKYFLSDAEMYLKEGPTWPFLNIWFRNKNFGIAIGAFGRIFKTEDGGKQWKSLMGKLNNPDGFHYYDTGELKEKIFLAGEGGILLKGNENGEKWKLLKSPSEHSFFGLKINKKINSIYVYGMTGQAFGSSNFGETWEKIFSLNNNHKIILSSIFSKNNSLCFLSHEGFLYCKDVNSDKFQKQTIKLRGCISICKNGNNEIYAACINGVHKFKVNPELNNEKK